jgi:hypothetical protein
LTTESVDRKLNNLLRDERVESCLNTSRFEGILSESDEIRCLALLQEQDGVDKNMQTVNLNDFRAIGVAIGQSVIDRYRGDGAAEESDYEAATVGRAYTPSNKAECDPQNRGVGGSLDNPNLWQRLKLGTYIDKNGNFIDGYPPFTTPHWTWVKPFALKRPRDFDAKPMFFDPGSPAAWGPDGASPTHQQFVDNITVVAILGAQLNQGDDVVWNTSPGALGNYDDSKPLTVENGGLRTPRGHRVNPHTGAPYAPNLVLRGDYARVTATFWAEGPMGSETPGAHWFRMLNWVQSQKSLQRRIGGKGFELNRLEYEVKAYLSIGAVTHDVAIAAWATKLFYNTVRPITAIRFLSELGQSSDPRLPRYHKGGIRLYPGVVELATEDARRKSDGLAQMARSSFCTSPQVFNASGAAKNCENEVSIFSWRPLFEMRWFPGDYWYPYMRPSFVTPTFPSYVSGHSAFARAAAEILERLTGDAFVPGGLMNIFIEEKWTGVSFGESTPSEDVVLQYATYSDAADACGLSRIWGSVHSPMDDVGGQRVGRKVAEQVWPQLLQLFGYVDALGTRHTLIIGIKDSLVDEYSSFALAHDALRERLLQLLREEDGDLSKRYRGRVANFNDVYYAASVKGDPDASVRFVLFAHAENTAERVVAKLLDSDLGGHISFAREVAFRASFKEESPNLSWTVVALLIICILLAVIVLSLIFVAFFLHKKLKSEKTKLSASQNSESFTNSLETCNFENASSMREAAQEEVIGGEEEGEGEEERQKVIEQSSSSSGAMRPCKKRKNPKKIRTRHYKNSN